MDFTVLQSVYKNDKPEYLDKALKSISEQTLLPKSIVLIKDGVVSEEINNVINNWTSKLPLKIVGYENNKGLAHALNFGLDFVNTELVARMDSDDYCFPNRFEKQVREFELNPNYEICGTGLSEFYIDKNGMEFRKERLYPVISDSKSLSLYKGTPLGHPTAMFKTSLLKQFLYSENTSMNEDIELWFRLIRAGHIIHNIQEPLLNFRITDNTFKRRSFKKAFNEFSIYKKNLLEMFGFSYRILYLFARLMTRFLPYYFNKKLYFSNIRSNLFNNSNKEK